jgi:hypothetical protein
MHGTLRSHTERELALPFFHQDVVAVRCTDFKGLPDVTPTPNPL